MTSHRYGIRRTIKRRGNTGSVDQQGVELRLERDSYSKDVTPSESLNRNLLVTSPLSSSFAQNSTDKPLSRRTMSLGGLALPNDLSADLESYNKELNSHLMGGFGVIRLGMLRNGQRVAIKTLKLHHVGLANIRHSKVCIANLCDSRSRMLF